MKQPKRERREVLRDGSIMTFEFVLVFASGVRVKEMRKLAVKKISEPLTKRRNHVLLYSNHFAILVNTFLEVILDQYFSRSDFGSIKIVLFSK